MPNPVVLYSTNTFLAFSINTHYYGGMHYVWCSAHFGDCVVPQFALLNPSTASPRDVYEGFRKAAARNDRRSPWIAQTKVGLQRGIAARLGQNVITLAQSVDLYGAMQNATPLDFRPLLYVIPYGRVRRIVERITMDQATNPNVIEYRIAELREGVFDIVDFGL